MYTCLSVFKTRSKDFHFVFSDIKYICKNIEFFYLMLNHFIDPSIYRDIVDICKKIMALLKSISVLSKARLGLKPSTWFVNNYY